MYVDERRPMSSKSLMVGAGAVVAILVSGVIVGYALLGGDSEPVAPAVAGSATPLTAEPAVSGTPPQVADPTTSRTVPAAAPTRTSTSQVAVPAPSDPAPVADAPALDVEVLMASAGCAGGLLDPKSYSRDVGRCTLSGHEVTVAVFDDNDRRDHWAAYIKDVGGTVVTGDGWAVAGIGAAGPEAFAAAVR
ncbi:hypothetical protein QTQ03_24720 [Micromonospora sp. WMMA1363]|uniref:hypothetical protein n=1 Tax=Micromonospora sp. WMMA1363 TaxID=3053985 RepID=UPI00259CE52E|nr:hypothetical protein [Micromonospora sp. WMMA1363]MDM4722641.1 hypothetical protein [Micromonospora sp. WMMA1363]